MNFIKLATILLSIIVAGGVRAERLRYDILTIEKFSDVELLINSQNVARRCRVGGQIIQPKLSSDGSAIIISGTSYVRVTDLLKCQENARIHVSKAAPHVGFLADVNLRAKIYASLVPVSVNPLSFVAVVGRLKSDRNLIQSPGFYRTNVARSTLLQEASPDFSPVLSLSGRYVSLNLRVCEMADQDVVSVFEVNSGKQVNLPIKLCEEKFRIR